MGRARGAVLVGRPLELTVPVTLDTAESDPCAFADLFHGDQRISRAPTVRWESRDGKEGVLRVTSDLVVDEPVVTLYLRVGCGQASSRRYVLLSELPPEETPSTQNRAAPASVPVSPAVAAAAAARAPGTGTGPGAGTGTGAGTGRAAAAAGSPRTAASGAAPPSAATTAAPAPVVRRPVAAAKPKAEPARPVLKLEPLDLSIDSAPTLRMSTEIGTQPSADPGKRQAAAALWQALQKSPDEAMQEALRLQAVQRELQSVREVTRQNAAAVAEMRTEVEKAQADRGLASMVAAALAAALAALLAVLGWHWYRARRVDRVGRWFEANGSPVAAMPPGAAARAPVLDVVVDAPASVGAASPPDTPRATPAAAPTSAGRGPTTVPAPIVAWSPSSQQEFQTSRGGTVRMVGVEELLDVHDKADFFLSIGETDQAVAVLETHVHDQVETSALPWMDLLELYHSLGRRAEFERVRGEFRERFAGQVPDFAHFGESTPTLESYGRALSRIVALWPTRRVLDVIEESIFRKPGLPGAEAFSLEAYRELVLLYHIATDIAPPEEPQANAPRITNFSDTSLQPLHALDAPERPSADVDLLLVPPASPNVGVDIDITMADSEPDSLPPLDFDLDLDPKEGELPDSGRGSR